MSETVSVKTRSLRDQVAEEIRVTLARRRLSATELARRMGVSQSYLARRMTGAQPLDLDDLDRIADALGVPVRQLLPGTDTFRYSPTAKRMSSRVPPQRRPAGRVDSNRPARPTGPTRPTTLPRPALPVMAR